MRSRITGDRAPRFDWGVAARPLAGERTSGDLCVVEPRPEGELFAVVDGLGHGEEAARAARRAAEALRAFSEEPLVPLLRRCHRALTGTRGAVMSLAALDLERALLSWIGVGNVHGALVRASPSGSAVERATLLLRGGVVGYDLPSLEVSVVGLVRGDLLILTTDGVRPDFAPRLDPGETPQRLADKILGEYGRDTDDGLVLVVRYGDP